MTDLYYVNRGRLDRAQGKPANPLPCYDDERIAAYMRGYTMHKDDGAQPVTFRVRVDLKGKARKRAGEAVFRLSHTHPQIFVRDRLEYKAERMFVTVWSDTPEELLRANLPDGCFIEGRKIELFFDAPDYAENVWEEADRLTGCVP